MSTSSAPKTKDASQSRSLRVRGPRPAMLNILFVLQWALVVAEFYFYEPNFLPKPFEYVTNFSNMTVRAALWVLLFYPLWAGANWARFVMLVLSLVYLTCSVTTRVNSYQAWLFVSALAGISLAWIVVLLLPSTARFTRGKEVKATANSLD